MDKFLVLYDDYEVHTEQWVSCKETFKTRADAEKRVDELRNHPEISPFTRNVDGPFERLK